MHGYHVGIALDHIHAIFFDNGLLGLIDAIEFAFLMINFRIGRIDVFLLDALRSRIELSATKGHYLTADIQPWEHGTTRKTVINTTFVLDSQSRLHQEFLLITFALGFITHRVTLREGKT